MVNHICFYVAVLFLAMTSFGCNGARNFSENESNDNEAFAQSNFDTTTESTKDGEEDVKKQDDGEVLNLVIGYKPCWNSPFMVVCQPIYSGLLVKLNKDTLVLSSVSDFGSFSAQTSINKDGNMIVVVQPGQVPLQINTELGKVYELLSQERVLEISTNSQPSPIRNGYFVILK